MKAHDVQRYEDHRLLQKLGSYSSKVEDLVATISSMFCNVLFRVYQIKMATIQQLSI